MTNRNYNSKYRKMLKRGLASAMIGGTLANMASPVLSEVSAHENLTPEIVDTLTDGSFEFKISEGHKPIVLEWNEDTHVETTAEDLGLNGEHPNSYSAVFPGTITRNETRSYKLTNGAKYRVNNIGSNQAGDKVDIVMTLKDHNQYNARERVDTPTISILSDRDIADNGADFNPSNPGSVSVLIMGADDVQFDVQFVKSGTDEPMDVSIAGYWSDIDMMQTVSENWTNRAFIWTQPDTLEREGGSVRAVTEDDAEGYADLDSSGYLGFGEGNSFDLRYQDTYGNFRFDLFGKFDNLTYDNRITPPETERVFNDELEPGSEDKVVQEGKPRVEDPFTGEVIEEGQPEIIEYAPEKIPFEKERRLNPDLEPGSEDQVIQEGKEGLKDPETDEILEEPQNEITEYAPEKIPFEEVRRLNPEMEPGSEDELIQEGKEGLKDPETGDIIEEPADHIVEYAPEKIPFETERHLNPDLEPGSEDQVIQEGKEGLKDPETDEILEEHVDEIIEYAPEEVPFETERRLNPELEAGSSDVVIQEGKPGLKDPDTDEVLEEPVDEIIEYAPEAEEQPEVEAEPEKEPEQPVEQAKPEPKPMFSQTSGAFAGITGALAAIGATLGVVGYKKKKKDDE